MKERLIRKLLPPFLQGKKCLYNYISGLTPLAESERCKGILRPFVKQTLGGDKDLHSRMLKNIQKHVGLAASLTNLDTFYLSLINNGDSCF